MVFGGFHAPRDFFYTSSATSDIFKNIVNEFFKRSFFDLFSSCKTYSAALYDARIALGIFFRM